MTGGAEPGAEPGRQWGRTRPAVVVHNSISADGAATGFLPHLGQHYSAAAALGTTARLVGSATMRSGLDHAEQPVPDPGPNADRPPPGRDGQQFWFLVDAHGLLNGRLHELRAFPVIRDVVVLVAPQTPAEYVAYLQERGYQHFCAGDEHVMLAEALPWIGAEFGVERILVDSGPILTRVLLGHDLVDEISLLVHPIVVGAQGRRIFEGLPSSHDLTLLRQRALEHGVVHLHYAVHRP